MERTNFIGIHPGAARGSYTLAALDEERKLQALTSGPLAAALAYCAGLERAIVVVDGPLNGPESSGADLPARMPARTRRSLALVDGLVRLGYQHFEEDSGPRRLAGVDSDTFFNTLLGVPPFAAGTLEGRIQRQLALYNEKLPVPDPMNFFEEVTAHKLLKGILPDRDIFSQAELQALACAWIGRKGISV